MPLTETRLRALKPKDKPYKVADDRGLYVEVTPSGGKLWRFRYRIGKLEKKLSIGNYPDISLKDARQATYEARQAVARGGDPALEKRKQKIRSEFLSAQTFEAVAREYIEQMMVQNGRAEGTVVKANYFLDQIAPAIGKRPVDQIEPFEILAPLKRLEAQGKHETAKKCRSFAGRVFRYGVATTRCQADPTSMLKGALVTPRATHYAAIIEPTELGGLLRSIDDYTGYPITKFALQIAPHVFVRPGELRHAEWHEFDLIEGIWKITGGSLSPGWWACFSSFGPSPAKTMRSPPRLSRRAQPMQLPPRTRHNPFLSTRRRSAALRFMRAALSARWEQRARRNTASFAMRRCAVNIRPSGGTAVTRSTSSRLGCWTGPGQSSLTNLRSLSFAHAGRMMAAKW